MYEPTELGKKLIIKLGEKMDECTAPSINKDLFYGSVWMPTRSADNIKEEWDVLESKGIIGTHYDHEDRLFMFLTNLGWQLYNFLLKS